MNQEIKNVESNQKHQKKELEQKTKTKIFTTIESLIGLFIFTSILVFPLLFALQIIKWDAIIFVLTFLFITFSLIFIEIIIVLIAKLQYKFTIDDWQIAQKNAVRSGIFDKMTSLKQTENILQYKEEELKQKAKTQHLFNKLTQEYGGRIDIEFVKNLLTENEELKQKAEMFDEIERELKNQEGVN